MHGVYVKKINIFIILILICLSVFIIGCLETRDGIYSAVSENDGDIVRNYDRSINPVNYETRESKGTTITVSVLDDLVRVPANIQVYKNGEFIQSVYMANGRHDFNNLEYGMYKFVVTDPDYITWWSDAFPSQDDYDNVIGEVELSAKFNTINYVIRGDNPKTRMSGFESSPNWYDKSATPIGRYLYQHVKNLRGLFNIN